MKKTSKLNSTAVKLIIPLLAFAACTSIAGEAITKADNTDALNLTTSWVGDSVPTSSDIALWDSTVTGGNTTILGGDLSFAGIQATNPGGAVNIGNYSEANTLTLGASGVDTAVGITLATPLALSADQTWTGSGGVTSIFQIDNGGYTLTANGGGGKVFGAYAPISGAGGYTQAGAATLFFGANTYTGTTTINGGYIMLLDGGSLSSLSPVTGSAGTLYFNGNSQTFANTVTGDILVTQEGAGSTVKMTGMNSYTGNTSIDVGSTLLVNGNNSGSHHDVFSGGTLGGTGTVKNLSVAAGGTLAPGGGVGTGPGTLTSSDYVIFSAGALSSKFTLQLNTDGSGVAGTNWSKLAAAQIGFDGATSSTPIIITLQTLDGTNAPGALGSFDLSVNHEWAGFMTAGYSGGYADNKFIVDTTGFANAFSGTFSVTNTGVGLGTELNLIYTAVPEPSSFVMMALGAGMMLMQVRRKRAA